MRKGANIPIMGTGARVCLAIGISIVAATACHGQANDNAPGAADDGTELTLQQKADAGDSKAQNEVGMMAGGESRL
jgi:hypothetical protein